MPHTVRLHRVVATKPEKIYRAFLEADALAKWLPPNGFTCTVHELKAKAGGRFKMPSQAPKSRLLENISPLPMVATVALDISGPMPGTVISRLHGASF